MKEKEMTTRLLYQRFGTRIMRVVAFSIILNLAICCSGLFCSAIVAVQEGMRGEWVVNRLIILFVGSFVFGLLLWEQRRYIVRDSHKVIDYLNFKRYDMDPDYYTWEEEEQ